MNLDIQSSVVLIFSVLVSFALLYYVRVAIPRDMERRYHDSFRAFSRAVELRFPRLSGQTDQVRRLSRMVGGRMGLDRQAMGRLESASMLRDLGLCAIPYRLLNRRAPDQWTPAEQAEFSRHPEIGATMLELIPSLKALAPIVRDHHNGGPDASIEANILSVVNAYVRGRAEYGPEVALNRLQRESGERFDARVVDLLTTMLISTRAAVEIDTDVILRTH